MLKSPKVHEISHAFWINFGIFPDIKNDRGRGGSVMSLLSGYNYAADNTLFSLRVLLHSFSPMSVYEVGGVYGWVRRTEPSKDFFIATISFGLGYVFGDYYTTTNTQKRESINTPGLAIDAQVAILPIFFGLGLGFHANINFVKSFGIVTAMFYIPFLSP